VRILQATNWYAPAYAFGGPTRLFEAYAQMLRARGVRVDVLTSDLITRTSFMGPHVVDLGSRGRITYVKALRIAALARRNIHLHFRLCARICMEAGRYDYIQFVDYRGLLPLVLLLVSRLRGVKLIHHSFGTISQRPVGKKRVWDSLFRSWFAKAVSLCFAENERERQDYLAIGVAREKVRLLPHPVVVPEQHRRAEGGATSDGPVPPAPELRLCFVGRLHPTKGVLHTVELMHALRPYFGAVRLTVMGDDEGALPDIARRVAALDLRDCVTLRGAAYDDSRFALYGESDAFVILPADDLQTSLAAAEALAVGTPVIANRNCRIDDLDEYVLYIDGKSTPEIARGIAALRSIPRARIARDAQRVFSVDEVARRLSEALV